MENDDSKDDTPKSGNANEAPIEEGGEGGEEVKKNHRRSKNDTEGRTYVCKICDKRYLSYPALYTHSKQKHHTYNNTGRGRGRPKKEVDEVRLFSLKN
ncbi:MAG: hypothetical protein MJ252_26710 [archaeon]|nr:hypothetical protein [archaeon]